MARSPAIPGGKRSKVPGAPRRVPGAPRSVPGGPPRVIGGLLTSIPDQPTSTMFGRLNLQQLRDFEGRFAGPFGMSWTGLVSTGENLNQWLEKSETNVREGMERLKDEMVEYMKSNHVWENRTWNAERGLRGQVIESANHKEIAIWLGHGVPYGVWLEIMQGGRFAILLPTLHRYSGEFPARIASFV